MTELATKQAQIKTMDVAIKLTKAIGDLVDLIIDQKTNKECFDDGYNRTQHLLSIVGDKKEMLIVIEDLLKEKVLHQN